METKKKPVRNQEQVDTLVDLMKMDHNAYTPEVRALFEAKYGKRPGGPSITAARKILGVYVKGTKPTAEPKTPPLPAEVTEALRIIQDAERVQQRVRSIEEQIHALEIELKAAKDELALYSKVNGQMRALTSAVQGFKSEIARVQMGGGK